jgi:iron complex outermembrane receptor protein
MVQLKAGLVGAAASILCAFLLLSTAYARADDRAPQPFDIGPQSLATALGEFARQSREEILFAPDVVAQKESGGVRGTMPPLAALKILLKDSGLPFSSTPNGAILVGTAGGAAPSVVTTQQTPADSQKEGKKSSSDGFRAAQVDQGTNSQSSTVGSSTSASQDNSKKVQIEEIVVTAQKREERLQEVPVPVTSISADSLISSDQVRLQDYYTRIPGLSVTAGEGGSFGGLPKLTIRGITTGGFSNPTVGIIVDDVPFGSSTNSGGGLPAPDIDPSDLARVEVLRGPQGTLYGASSMGGLLKFVTVDPSTDGVSGRVQAGTSSVYNGAELGYNFRGAVNVPLGDTFAIRASAFTRQDPGYVDDPGLHSDGVNEGRTDGGRLSALWKPSSIFSIKLSALIQDAKADGSSFVDILPGLGDLQQSAVRDSGRYDRKTQAYSATINSTLGGIDVTAVSGYNISKLVDAYDFSAALGSIAQNGVPGTGFNGFGVPGVYFLETTKTNKFSQEIRLSAPIGERFEWLLGAFYTHEKSSDAWDLLAAVPATGVAVGSVGHFNAPTTLTEYAVFTDLTYHFTDRFDIQVGGRESQDKQTYTSSTDLVFLPASVVPEVDAKANAFTYLVTPRFRVSTDLMIYARLASGYRAGGPNLNPLSLAVVAPTYAPDKTQNYEIGVKGDVLDRTLSFDASIYYIDWKDIQIQVYAPGTTSAYTTNGSRAKSQGVELSAESKPLTGLTIAAWVAWNDAALTEPFPLGPVYGVSGDRLPYSSRVSGNLSADQEFALAKSITGFVGASVSFVGDREGVFTGSPQRQNFPSYAQTDLRAGLRYDSWTANFFVNNVSDKRAATSGGVGAIFPFAYVYIQPRTVGLSVAKAF